MAKRQTSIRFSEAATEKLAALTERYGSQTAAVEVAIDRLYQSEIGEDTMHTVYTIPTNADYYGNTVTDDQAGYIADYVETQLQEYAEEQGYDVEFRQVPEVFSRNNQPRGDQGIIEDLGWYHEDHMEEWDQAAWDEMPKEIREDTLGSQMSQSTEHKTAFRCSPGEDISATDLSEQLAECEEEGIECEYGTWQEIDEEGYLDSGETGEYLYVWGRLGVVEGGDADWADVPSVEEGLDMYLNDPKQWRRRN